MTRLRPANEKGPASRGALSASNRPTAGFSVNLR
jgi:hypothetical protein